jgi:hypothetical protein
MGEWLADDVDRGQAVLTAMALAIGVGIVWAGRKNLKWAVPLALGQLFLAAIVIPNAIPARPAAFRNACKNNLRLIQDAKARWAKAGNNRASDVPTENDLTAVKGAEAFLRFFPSCPGGGKYTIGSVGENPACSLASKGHALE